MDTDTLQLVAPRTGKPAITITGLANARSAGAGGNVPASNIRFNADASTEDLVETWRYYDAVARSWPAFGPSIARELEHRGVNVQPGQNAGSRLDTSGLASGRDIGNESRR